MGEMVGGSLCACGGKRDGPFRKLERKLSLQWRKTERERERERETVKGKQNEVKRGGIYNQVKKERKIILMRTHQKAKEKSEGQEMDREREGQRVNITVGNSKS
jgi:hypothetical protein